MVVRVGEAVVGRRDTILCTYGIGSCVAIALRDSGTGVAGLAHALLPHPENGSADSPPARFASTAVKLLMDTLVKHGAEPSRLRAWLVGCASMFQLESNGGTIGSRNLAAARAALAEHGVPIGGEEVGGTSGRSLAFEVDLGRIVVMSALGGPPIVLT